MIARRVNMQVWIYLVAFLMAISVGVASAIQPKMAAIGFSSLLIGVFVVVLSLDNPLKLMKQMSIVLAISVFIIPSISVGPLSFRVDDAVVVIMVIASAVVVKNNMAPKVGFSKPITAYLIYTAAITLAQILFSALSPIYFLYYVKEIQYFVYFFVVLSVVVHFGEKSLKNAVLVSAFLTILWGVYQLSTGNIRGFYGIGIISETSPSQSGAVFLAICLLMIYMKDSIVKRSAVNYLFWLFAGVISFALTIATVSRTAIISLGASLLIYAFFKIVYKKIRPLRLVAYVYLLALSIPIALPLIQRVADTVIYRLSAVDEGTSIRTSKWDHLFVYSEGIGDIFGNGRGYIQQIVQSFTLAADSMYVRQLVEIGYVGLFIWLAIIGYIICFSLVNLKTHFNEAIFIIMLTSAYMVMSVTHEVFMVSIQATLYWILVGLMSGKIIREKQPLKVANEVT